MMGAVAIRRSLSPLHAECEALIWAMECMKTLQISEVVFTTDCSQLVKIHLQNGQRSLHTWRSLCDVRNFFTPLLFNIFRGHKTQLRISWHEVLGISLLLWFMLTQFPQGSWIKNHISFILAFCCKKNKK